MIYIVFPFDPDEMPKYFQTFQEAKQYAEEKELDGYEIEATEGDVL